MDYWPYPPVEADRIDPFDTSRTETQYVMLSRDRATYAFTDLTRTYGKDLSTWIPMGYTILLMAQKVAVLRHGDVVREWPVLHRDDRVDPPEQPAGTTLYLDIWRRGVCGYVVMTPPMSIMAVVDAYDPAAAMGLAATTSRAEGCAVLLYAYDAENWH